MTYGQALFLGALQGVSELFPVSSLGQTILLPDLLKWDMGSFEDGQFLSVLVALHLATAVALVIYFWNDWKVVLAAYVGSFKKKKFVYDDHSKFAWMLVAGSIVVGLIGFIFEKQLRLLFEKPKYAWVVAAVLIANGFMMLAADFIKRKLEGAPGQKRNAEELTMIEAASIGATQTLALIPGVSRSGVTIVAGLLAGLTYEQATRFSFMLGTVIIGLAGIKKVPTLLRPEARDILPMTIAGALVAGFTAYLSTKFLMRYFKNHNLKPFGLYCILFGAFALIMLRP